MSVFVHTPYAFPLILHWIRLALRQASEAARDGVAKWNTKNEWMMDLSAQKETRDMASLFMRAIGDHAGILYKICRSYGNIHDHEDLYQDMIYQLWKSFPSFRGESTFSTWMYRIALNVASSAYNAPRPKIELPGSVPDVPVFDGQTGSREDDEYFEFFQTLDKIERSILILMAEGYSRTEISDMTGISKKAITMRLSRLKKTIIISKEQS